MLDDDIVDTLDDGVAAMLVLQWRGEDDVDAVKVADTGEPVP